MSSKAFRWVVANERIGTAEKVLLAVALLAIGMAAQRAISAAGPARASATSAASAAFAAGEATAAAAAPGALAAIEGDGGHLGSSAARGDGPSPARDLAPARPVFVAVAEGVTRRGAAVRSMPSGGRPIAELAAGVPVEIAGQLKVRSWLWWRSLYWVRWQAAGGPGYGFLAVGDVDVEAGRPPRVRLATMVAAGDIDGPAASSPSSGGAGSSGPVAAPADITVGWLPATVRAWREPLLDAGVRYGVDPDLLAIVMLVESGGNPKATSPSGAMGLMQVMPFHFADGEDGYDPVTSIDVGARYLARQLAAFGRADDPDWQHSVEMAALAYNGGPGTATSVASGGSPPSEAARYRYWVGGMWRERHQADSPVYGAWMAAGGQHLVDAAAAVQAGS